MVKSMRKNFLLVVVLSCFLSLQPMAFAAPGNGQLDSDYSAGFVFGQQNADSIQGNIVALREMAEENGLVWKDLLQDAQETEKMYSDILPGKLRWMHGVADGSGIPYDDILVFNMTDKEATGESGECTTFMAQGKALQDGVGTIIAKNRDQSINTLSEIEMPERSQYADGELYKAAYIEIPQVKETYKFIGSRTAGRWGYGMGVNEFQVIVADNDANSRDLLDFENSLHDNDVVRLILERAKTAREGVEVATALVEKYGQAWNGIMFEIGDPNELWVVEVTGHRWVAKKYVDTVTARSNQFQIGSDYDLAADDLVSFAQDQGWVAKDTAGKINFKGVYGTKELYPADNSDIATRPAVETLYNTQMRYQRAMELLTAKESNIDLKSITTMVRDHYDTYTLPSGKVIEMNQVPFYSSDAVDWYDREWMADYPDKDTIETSIYIRSACGHDLGWGATSATGVLFARPNVPNGLGLMLHSFMQPCMSTFVPFYVGQDSVDKKYSSTDAADLFHTIALKSFGSYQMYHPGVRAAFDPYEEKLFTDMNAAEKKYQEMTAGGQSDQAGAYLTGFVKEKGNQALSAADQALVNMRQAAIDASSW